MKSIIQTISLWAESKSSWLILFLSSLALSLTALYFQYGLDLQPCIMCIYQRTAMYGIVFSALLVLIFNHALIRLVAFAGWAVSSVWGFLIASEHVEILHDSSFFASCEFVPDFPSWAPLHEWLPAIFEARGMCTDDTWQFMSMGMAEWMQIIFAAYAITFAIVFLCKLIDKKPF